MHCSWLPHIGWWTSPCQSPSLQSPFQAVSAGSQYLNTQAVFTLEVRVSVCGCLNQFFHPSKYLVEYPQFCMGRRYKLVINHLKSGIQRKKYMCCINGDDQPEGPEIESQGWGMMSDGCRHPPQI